MVTRRASVVVAFGVAVRSRKSRRLARAMSEGEMARA